MQGPRSIWKAVLLTVSFCLVAWATERPIDVDNNVVRGIHVRKAGLFSVSGHEHWVTAPIVQGSVEEGEPSHVAFAFLARNLMLEPDKGLNTENQAEVQQTMQEKVLESERYPEISFRSTSVQKTGSDTWTVTGIRALHGHSNSVPLFIELWRNTCGVAGSGRPTSALNRSARVGPGQNERRTGY
jgi:hypothetical protein